MSKTLFDNTGQAYNVSKIMANGVFHAESYEAYIPPYMTASYAIVFMCFLGAYLAAVSIFCYTTATSSARASQLCGDGEALARSTRTCTTDS